MGWQNPYLVDPTTAQDAKQETTEQNTEEVSQTPAADDNVFWLHQSLGNAAVAQKARDGEMKGAPAPTTAGSQSASEKADAEEPAGKEPLAPLPTLLRKRQVQRALRYNDRRFATAASDSKRWRVSPEEIRAMQQKVGAPTSGALDAATAQAVAAFQKSSSLSVDGQLGPKTGEMVGLKPDLPVGLRQKQKEAAQKQAQQNEAEPKEKEGESGSEQTSEKESYIDDVYAGLWGTSQDDAKETKTGAEGAEAEKNEQEQELEPVEPPKSLRRREVERYFNRAFDAQFKGKGLFHSVFRVHVSGYKRSRRPFKGEPEHKSIEGVWRAIAADMSALSHDVRKFRSTQVLWTADRHKRSLYIRYSAKLYRRAVTRKEGMDMEQDLVPVGGAHAHEGRKLKVDEDVYEAYKSLYQAANSAGLTSEVDGLFQIRSAYRSVSTQQRLFERKIADLRDSKKHPGKKDHEIRKLARKWVAAPGTSAHNTGHAVDLYMGWSIKSENAQEMKKKGSELRRKYGKYYDWLQDNAPKYGFLPYAPEPWHWEKWK
jgi:LAS superfamily LD-carboxypeptidase LdcB/peptidoglycan hydrolase-like protein with peptidoglycan-binding domain